METNIAIIGLGYVGTPLLAAFAQRNAVMGFDVDANRVAELLRGDDRTGELSDAERKRVQGMTLTSEPADLSAANVFVVTVPTPVLEDKSPDMRPLQNACQTLGPVLKKDDTVIFESTVYPGATEEVCVPILERLSGLTAVDDFWYGYSPERINPGDTERRLQGIVKVTSGCCEKSAEFIDQLYAAIVPAGTHKASSVRVAEAAKVIENTQRDVNIALVNELAMLFDRLDLNTQEVLEAAGTKWNFLPFTPGLVGGHCIGVDPYYLTHKARQVGFEPNIILAGRGVNDGMAAFVAGKVTGLIEAAGGAVNGARVLVMGLTFKENCPDTRNSQVYRLIELLQGQGCVVDVMDPWVSELLENNTASGSTAMPENVELIKRPVPGTYQAVISAVAHRQFDAFSVEQMASWGSEHCVFYDIKNRLSDELVTGRL